MEDALIFLPKLIFTGKELIGENVERITRRMGDLRDVFEDKAAFEVMDPNLIAYHVSSIFPVKEGTPGGLFMGITYLMPGKV